MNILIPIFFGFSLCLFIFSESGNRIAYTIKVNEQGLAKFQKALKTVEKDKESCFLEATKKGVKQLICVQLIED